MPIAQIPRDNPSGVYFITPTVWRWYYIFDRRNHWQILANSLQYLQKNRGLEIFGFVFMLNPQGRSLRSGLVCFRSRRFHRR